MSSSTSNARKTVRNTVHSKKIALLGRLSMLAILVVSSIIGLAQTVPTAQSLPYTSAFPTFYAVNTTTTNPAGWAFHQIAGALATTFPTGAPSADRTLLASGSQSNGGNDAMNFHKKIGSLAGATRGIAPVLAVVTTGLTTITVTYTIGTCRVASSGLSAASDVELQYRAAGTNGVFTSAGGTVYTTYSASSRTASGDTSSIARQTITVVLPVGAENLATLQLRWATKSANGTVGGSRASWTIDNVSVSGTASGNPALAVSGTASHGSSCPGVAATPITYTITNNGTSATNVVVSSNDAQFVVSGLSSTSIAASGTATFNVTFTPSSAGSKSATISTFYNTSTASGTIALTGTGTTAVTAAVTSSAASSVTSSGATLNGNVTTLGVCPASTQKGFVYSLTATNADPLDGGTG